MRNKRQIEQDRSTMNDKGNGGWLEMFRTIDDARDLIGDELSSQFDQLVGIAEAGRWIEKQLETTNSHLEQINTNLSDLAKLNDTLSDLSDKLSQINNTLREVGRS